MPAEQAHALTDFDDALQKAFPLTALPQPLLKAAGITCAAKPDELTPLKLLVQSAYESQQSAIRAHQVQMDALSKNVAYLRRTLGAPENTEWQNQVIKGMLDQREPRLLQMSLDTQQFMTGERRDKILDIIRQYEANYPECITLRDQLQSQLPRPAPTEQEPAPSRPILRVFTSRASLANEARNIHDRGTHCFEHLADIAAALDCDFDPSLLIDHVLGAAPGNSIRHCAGGIADTALDHEKAVCASEQPLTPTELARLSAIGIEADTIKPQTMFGAKELIDRKLNACSKRVLWNHFILDLKAQIAAGDTRPRTVAIFDDNTNVLQNMGVSLIDFAQDEPEIWRLLDVKLVRFGPKAENFEVFGSSKDIWVVNAWQVLREKERELYRKITSAGRHVSDAELLQRHQKGAVSQELLRQSSATQIETITLQADPHGYVKKYLKDSIRHIPLFFRHFRVVLLRDDESVFDSQSYLADHKMGLATAEEAGAELEGQASLQSSAGSFMGSADQMKFKPGLDRLNDCFAGIGTMIALPEGSTLSTGSDSPDSRSQRGSLSEGPATFMWPGPLSPNAAAADVDAESVDSDTGAVHNMPTEWTNQLRYQNDNAITTLGRNKSLTFRGSVK